jgi:hypothetical protein
MGRKSEFGKCGEDWLDSADGGICKPDRPFATYFEMKCTQSATYPSGAIRTLAHFVFVGSGQTCSLK